MRKVLLNDVTVRDGNQSLLATRMEREDIISLVSALDKVGFNAMEVWGGATFDASLRFLNESPWEILREIRQAAKNTKLSMLLRGQNLVGYRHYDNDTLERFIKLAIDNGIDIIRVFDALNDLRNVEHSIRSIKKHGGHCQCAISYTVSPIHTEEYFVDLVKKMAELGADSICIKDMAGILMPDAAYSLVKALKAVTDLPIDVHSHTTAGLTHLVMLRAMEAGADIVDTAISPFSGGTSHIATETIIETAKNMGIEVSYNAEALDEAYELADKIAQKYIDNGLYKARALVVNPKILQYEVPGGMLSNLMSQLQDQKMFHKLNDVLKEIPKVRKEMGYPPLVTPLSQMVGTQSVLNVIAGERYKMIPNEIKVYVRGGYGKSPAPIDEAMIKKVLGDEAIEPRTPIEEMPPVFEESKKEMEALLGREAKDEEVISYIMNPKQAVLKPKTTAVQEVVPSNATKKASESSEVIAFEMIIER